MNHTKLRKALGQFLAAVSITALLVPFTAPLAFAGPTEDVQAKFFGQESLSGIVLGGTLPTYSTNTVNSTVIMNLSYSGSAASSNITVGSGGTGGANCITFYAPEGTVDTSIGVAAAATTCGTSGGTFDLGAAGYTTLGQLCDAINGVQSPFVLNGNANGGAPTGSNYHCTLVGGVRSDSATNFIPAVTEASGVNNLNALGGYSVPSSTASILSLGIIPVTGRHVVLSYCAVNSQGTPAVQVLGVPVKYGISNGLPLNQFGAPVLDSNVAWQSAALVANTTTNEPVATVVSQPWLEFGGGGNYSYALNTPAGHAPNPPVGNQYNGHVVVRVNNYGLGAAVEASTNFVSCNWQERSN